MITIIFEAHATSKDNEAGLASGHYDVELSELGEKQAKELGARYTNADLAAVFCSDLQRSSKTAAIAFRGREIKIIQDRRLRECNYGDLTRHPSLEVEELKSEYIESTFPGGKSYAQTTKNMTDFLRELQNNFQGKKVLIIGHRATQYALENLVHGTSLSKAVTDHWAWQPGWEYVLE